MWTAKVAAVMWWSASSSIPALDKPAPCWTPCSTGLDKTVNESQTLVSTLQTLLPLSPTVIEWVGTCAAILTTGSFIPQAWLIFRTRQVEGISVGMYSAFTLGVALWLLYGVATGSWPITMANAITLTLASAILVMRLRFRQPDQNC